MVSTEKYLTTFFVVMKQRFEVLQQLTTEKQKINGLIFQDEQPYENYFLDNSPFSGYKLLSESHRDRQFQSRNP